MPNPILVISHIFLVMVANTGLLSLLLLGWVLLPWVKICVTGTRSQLKANSCSSQCFGVVFLLMKTIGFGFTTNQDLAPLAALNVCWNTQNNLKKLALGPRGPPANQIDNGISWYIDGQPRVLRHFMGLGLLRSIWVKPKNNISLFFELSMKCLFDMVPLGLHFDINRLKFKPAFMDPFMLLYGSINLLAIQ